MKLHLIAAVLSWALLSLSYANVIETEQSLSQLEEVPQNVDKQIATVEEPIEVASPEVQKVLLQIPELIQAVANEQTADEATEQVDNIAEAVAVPEENNTEAVAVPKEMEVLEASLPNSREGKQLIGFIPAYVLREAIRLAQEQQSYDVRSLKYENDDELEEDDSNEIEEERAIRRRKRFRRRNAKGHLKKSRRHKNTNRRNLKKHRNFNVKRKSKPKVSKRKNLKKPLKKKRKTSKRKEN